MIRILDKRLDQIIRESIEDVIDRDELYRLANQQRGFTGGNVTQFTPYPEGHAEKDLQSMFKRTPEERNPWYAKAKREAEERMRQKRMMQGK